MYPVSFGGETIALREFRDDDAAALAGIIGEPDVLRYTTWKGPTDLAAAKGFIRLARETAEATPRLEYLLAIESVETGEVVGTGGIRIDDPDERMGSLRVMLHPDWWGHGFATEAARIGVAFGFETLGLRRIEADPALENPAAHAVLEKVGFQRLEVREGHHLAPGGIRRSSVRFAIAREDWQP